MSRRPKKLSLITKEQIQEIATHLANGDSVTISNLCVIELKEGVDREYHNISTGKNQKGKEYRVSIRKARYLKDIIDKTVDK